MEGNFITTPALFRGLGFSGWQGTTTEEALKVALLCSKRLYTPLSASSLEWLIQQFAEREGISTKLLQGIWLSEPVNPSAFDPSFLLGVRDFLMRGFLDKRIRTEDRQHYLLLLAAIVEAEEEGSQQWYDHLFSTGLFFVLNFVDAIIWDRYGLLNRDVSLIASDDAQLDYRILRRYLLGRRHLDETVDKRKHLIELHIPDFGKIAWPAILELRRDKRVVSFQEHLNRLSTVEDDVSAAQSAIDEVWKATADIEPNIPAVVLEGVIGNVPLPIPINPLSLGASLIAFVRAIRWRMANKWFTFAQQLRKAAVTSKPPTLVSEQPFVGGEGIQALQEGYMWLTNHPDQGYVESRLHNKPVEVRDGEYVLMFRPDESVDVFFKKRTRSDK